MELTPEKLKDVENFTMAQYLNYGTCYVWHKAVIKQQPKLTSYVNDVNRREHIVSDVFDNDFNAIVSKLFFVQSREPSSMYTLQLTTSNNFFVSKFIVYEIK